jgi:hypothetical protein
MGRGGGFIRGAAFATTVVAALFIGAPMAGAAKAPAGTTLFSYQSEVGDFVGQGHSGTYTPPSSQIQVSGTLESLDMSVNGPGGPNDFWTFDIAAPRGDVLRPGLYPNAERAAFRTGRAPGLDVSGQGRGCNEVFGDFAIDQIAADASGAITLLDASFTQHCELADRPALRGVVQFRALPLQYQFTSDPGDYIGQGQSKLYRNRESVFTFSGFPTYITYGVSGQRDTWSVNLQPPTGKAFKAGSRFNAHRSPDATFAGLDVSGDSRGCNQVTGTITILHLLTDSSGHITNFKATFVQHCEGGQPALRGTIDYFA